MNEALVFLVGLAKDADNQVRLYAETNRPQKYWTNRAEELHEAIELFKERYV